MAHGRLRSWAGRAAVGAVSVAALTACGSGTTASSLPALVPGATGAPATTASPTAAPSMADDAKAEALASYRGMWADFADAGRTSDWQSSKLGRYATGIALTNLSRSLYTDHRNGLITKGEPILDPSVASAEPAAAPSKVIVSDCGDSTNALRYRADNGQLDDTPGGRRAINAIVEKQSDGSWKVSDFGIHAIGTC